MEKREWTLPKHKQYRVKEKKGRDGKSPCEGTVTCQAGGVICVNFDDGWVMRTNINKFVRIEAPSQPPQYQ